MNPCNHYACGTVSALWVCEKDGVRHALSTPVPAVLHLDGKTRFFDPGQYTFLTQANQ